MTSSVLLALVLSAAPDATATLETLEWRARVLVLFEGGEEAIAKAQLECIAARRAGLVERDLVVLRVRKEEVRLGGETLEGAAALRERFSPGEGFTAILIGKDGTEKLRETGPLDIDRLFAAIDRMPMRRREMKE